MNDREAARQTSEREARMLAIGSIYRRWEEGEIGTPMAIQKCHEALEPPIVRTGGQHVPDIQTTSEPPARTPAARANREFTERNDGTATPF